MVGPQTAACSACHVRLRPQLLSDLRLAKETVTCESCKRILYWTSRDGRGATRARRRSLVLYFDGASRGNPGPSSYGVWSPSGLEKSDVLGHTTNNVAEWRGFLAALDLAVASGAEDVEIRADSQLVLRQFSGEYRMKAPHLAEYLQEARARRGRIARLRVVHVPREENREADALANRALDAEARQRTGDRDARVTRAEEIAARVADVRGRIAEAARRARPRRRPRHSRRRRQDVSVWRTSSRRYAAGVRRSARTASRKRRRSSRGCRPTAPRTSSGRSSPTRRTAPRRSRPSSRPSTRKTSPGGWTARPRRSGSASAPSSRSGSAGKPRSRASSRGTPPRSSPSCGPFRSSTSRAS